VPDSSSRTTDGPRPRGRGLRAYFALLVVVFVVTSVGATAYVFVQSDRDGRRDAERNARFAADTAARQLGNAVATLQATAKGVAATPQIEQALTGKEACALQFPPTGGLEAGHIEILRADGTVACSSRTAQGGAPLRGYQRAPWLRRATAGPQFSAPVVDSAAGGHAALATSPIRGGVVAAFLALEPAGPGLARLYGGGRPVEFVVTSRDGQTVIARSIDPRRRIGTSIEGSAFQTASGDVERPDLDGTRRLYADAPVPGVGWRFSVGEDKQAALAAAARLRDRQLAIILAGLVLMLAAAFAVYRRVAVPVTRLGTAVRSTSELSPPAPVAASGPAEVTALGADINGLIASVNHELTERERAERNYRLLFENSPLPMWIFDVDTRAVLAVNDAALASYGYAREEFLALTMHDIEASGDATVPPDATHTARHRRKDGSELQVRTTAHAVTFADRAARFVMAEDVGERERLESQLRQAQRMEAIGRLAGGVAHDFNNLLTAILGNTELLLARTPPEDPRRRDAEEVKKAGERAAALTRQLLTFGRSQPRAPVAVDLNETIRGLEPMLQRLIRSNIAIVTELARDAAPLRADRGQLEQVIVNLVVNAGDAMPDGGTLTIATSETELDEHYFRLHPAGQGSPGSYAVLEVADTGVGMDPETLSHIFEPFFTTKSEQHGTGLGLATVYGIVRQTGGFIWAYSEPHRGTSFKVYLPVAGAAIPARPATRPTISLASAGHTVLLVEDDDAVRATVRRMLDMQGFAIVEAERGDDALALSEAGDPASLTLLVTDTIIPGPGGIELANRVRQRHPALRTLIMSGYTEPTTGDEGLGPNTEFIAKPFSASELEAKLASLLAATAPGDEDR